MSNNSTIDDLFKAQLQPLDFAGADQAWNGMEKKLLGEQEKHEYKRYLLILLLLTGLAAFFTYLSVPLGSTIKLHARTFRLTYVPEKPQPAPAHTGSGQGDVFSAPPPGNSPVPAAIIPGKLQTKKETVSSRVKATITAGNSFDCTIDHTGATTSITDNTISGTEIPSDKSATETISAEKAVLSTVPVKPSMIPYSALVPVKPPAENHKRKRNIELAAGVDIFLKRKSGGKYAQLLLNIRLNNHAGLLTGTGIASHNMSESYRVSEKQNTSNRETDAKLQSLTMLQVPVLYQQAIPRTKLTGRAGITPVYIIDASIVNVPSAFVGTVIPYRTFTLKDLNRFNVLFTAGIQYRALPWLAFELKGNYGLTELVKDSYINQSNVNNNFKSVQLGLSYRF